MKSIILIIREADRGKLADDVQDALDQIRTAIDSHGGTGEIAIKLKVKKKGEAFLFQSSRSTKSPETMNMHVGHCYSAEDIEKIAGWLRDGLSASQISGMLSTARGFCVSRNAVIGIVHRNRTLKQIGFARGHPHGKRPPREPKQSRVPGTKAPKQVRAEGSAKRLRRSKVGRSWASPAYLPARQYLADTRRLDASPRAALDLRIASPRHVHVAEVHRVGMKFLDCLFDRCRMPADLSLDARATSSMLCCGIKLRPGEESFCASCKSRLTDRKPRQ